MKKQNAKKPERVTPVFVTEAEEAEWWFKNRNEHGDRMREAVKSGEAQVLTNAKLRARVAASRKAP